MKKPAVSEIRFSHATAYTCITQKHQQIVITAEKIDVTFYNYGKCSKKNISSCSQTKSGNHKMLVRITNREV